MGGGGGRCSEHPHHLGNECSEYSFGNRISKPAVEISFTGAPGFISRGGWAHVAAFSPPAAAAAAAAAAASAAALLTFLNQPGNSTTLQLTTKRLSRLIQPCLLIPCQT
ncbi:hypothetical protein E2C01_014730 [Portunus trituberculatus]|uniref:Uncharacterized protein n=1 Tax=Portunus trituberculatus TaxID=210409 RepID=A0A5B7DKQ8_PORTR|nr:hypothetical protein [Portunus trituberculatus]